MHNRHTLLRQFLPQACLLFFTFLVHPAFSADTSVFVSAAGLKLGGQPGWAYYQDHDAPEGAYLAQVATGTATIVADVNLGQTVTPGEYLLFIKVIDYDFKSLVQVTSGGANASSALDDRDVDKYWTRIAPLRITEATGNVRLVFTKSVATTTPTRILFRALYLVAASGNVTVTATDQVMNIQFPTEADYDNSPPVKGNLLGGGSFEAGLPGGWSSNWSEKDWDLRSLWDTTTAYRGRASIRMESRPSPPQTFMSPPMRLKPNKRYTLSAYVRSTGARQWVAVELVNSLSPSAGMTPAPRYSGGKLLTASSNWERIVFSDRILAYPSDQFHVVLWCQQNGNEGAGSVWFDSIQLEEGEESAYQPREQVDLGVLMPNAGSIFHPGSVQGQLLVANHFATSMAGNVRYEITDHLLRVQMRGTIPVSISPNSTTSYTLPLDVHKLGSFRGTLWTEDMPAQEAEFLFSIVPLPSIDGPAEDSIIGIHTNHTEWQLDMLRQAGIKWTRNLSPGAHFRWNLAEPKEGEFVWFDADVQRPKKFGITLLGNIGENAPTWAQRTYFTVSNPVGAFQVGEAVQTQSGASGTISVLLDSTNATGWALQLSDIQGVFTNGNTITGRNSNATAVISSPIYNTSIALDKWENFVRSIVSHYKADVKWWEVWNEPHLDVAEVPNAAFYAEMLRRAVRATKSSDPGAKVVAMGGIFRPEYGIDVFAKLNPAEKNDIAVISSHLYPGNGAVMALLKQTPEFSGKAIWNTETGTWDWGGFVGVNANVLRAGISLFSYRTSERFYRSAVDSPVLLARNFLRSVGLGASKYFYYDARNSASRADSFESAPTLIDYNEGLKPKGVVYAILAHLFDRSTGLGSVTTKNASTEAYLFDRAGVPTVALFCADGLEREIDVSASLSPSSFDVFDLMGNQVEGKSPKVRYGLFPAYLVGKGISISQMRQAVELGSIGAIADTEAPTLSVTVAPRLPLRVGSEATIRWLALDNVSLPDEVDPRALEYSWRLDGVDADWTGWRTDTFASYFTLAQGRYVFRVKARDKAGNVSSEQTRTFVVVSSPAAPTVLGVRP